MKNIIAKIRSIIRTFSILYCLLFCTNISAQLGVCPTCIGPGLSCTSIVISPLPSATCPSGNPYILVFDDEFTGDALDLSKWLTCNPSAPLIYNAIPTPYHIYNSVHGGTSSATVDYDNGLNYLFTHPGVALVEANATTFTAYANDNDLAAKIEPDGNANSRPWSFTSSNLYSQYTFPSIGQSVGMNGIYVLTCTLPQDNNPYASGTNPYGSYGNYGDIWPAFWMWWNIGTDYGELDGFEFSRSEYEDIQTSHSPAVTWGCAWTTDPGGINFGDGTSRTFTLIYSTNENDWYVGSTETRQDTKYFYQADASLSLVVVPYTCNNQPTSTPAFSEQNTIFPDVPMQLMVDNAVRIGADPSKFPVHFEIQSVKYYEPLPCSGTTVVTPSMVVNV